MPPHAVSMLLAASITVGALARHADADADAGVDDDAQADRDVEIVYYDAPDDQGRLTGGRVLMPRPTLVRWGVEGGVAGDGPNWVTIIDNGPPSNRIDMVIVGDGYLQDELAFFAQHVDNALLDIFSQEPFLSYATFFNVHRVDVVSNESGVDNDPVQGIERDTAMDMGFWCGGIERLLCVDVNDAWNFALFAPDVDHILAVANSTKYGGAGYIESDLATFSGGNKFSTEVAIHEMGHSLGNLADEYYFDGANYNGGERPERNVSILPAEVMALEGEKWADWLGNPGDGFGGLVDTYEGAYYAQFGIYRPTFDSKMRTLERPFNPPSVEGLIIEMYKQLDPIDDATPGDSPLREFDVVFVDPLDPASHALDIEWLLDGETIEGESGTTLDLATLDLSPGEHGLKVIVVDNTPFVIDDDERASHMTAVRSWTVETISAAADLNDDGVVNAVDLLLLLAVWGPCDNCDDCSADLDGSCDVGGSDLILLLGHWG